MQHARTTNEVDDAPLALPSITMVARRCEWAVPCCTGPTVRSPTLYVWVVKPAEEGLKALAVARRPVATRAVNFIAAGIWVGSVIRKYDGRGST